MILTRRGFLAGIGAVLAAPAIVRAESLMPVRAPRLVLWPQFEAERDSIWGVERRDFSAADAHRVFAWAGTDEPRLSKLYDLSGGDNHMVGSGVLRRGGGLSDGQFWPGKSGYWSVGDRLSLPQPT